MNDPYRKTIPRREDGTSDIYDVIFAYKVSNPAVEHAVKKLLCPGVRGAKGVLQDLDEARKSIVRAIELEQGALVAEPERRVLSGYGVRKDSQGGVVLLQTAHVADALRECPACLARYPADQNCPTKGCPT